MKKLSFIAIFLMFLSLMVLPDNSSAASVWDVDFAYQTLNVSAGQTFEYKMMVTSNETGFTDVTFSSVYSAFSKSGFTITGITKGSLLGSGNMTVGVNYDNVQISGASIDKGKTGDLFVVSLKAPSDISKTTTYSIPINIAKVSKNNYNLDVDKVNGSITVSTASVTTYTVSFDSNGGSGAPSSISKTQGTAVSIPSTEPTRNGYKFIGWSSAKSSTKPEYTAGVSFNEDKNITLYAVWEIITQQGWNNNGGEWYYYLSDNQKAYKWQRIDGTWYYFNTNGVMVTGWNYIDNRWFYMNSNGYMQTGWQHINGVWYYFNTDGAMAIGWKNIGGRYFYFNADGSMATGWVYYARQYYYMNLDGSMATGWVYDAGKYYYMNNDGSMRTGWYKEGTTYYYLRPTGMMVTGWNQINHVWYYFSASGAMSTGWKLINGSWYYFTSDGAMVAGKSLNLSGKVYTFNASGICINP